MQGGVRGGDCTPPGRNQVVAQTPARRRTGTGHQGLSWSLWRRSRTWVASSLKDTGARGVVDDGSQAPLPWPSPKGAG